MLKTATKNTLLPILAPIFLLCLIGFGVYFYYSHLQKQSISHATLLDKPRFLSSFSMPATTGSDFSDASLKGHWTLIFFGFAQCPQMCPMMLAELKNFYHGLQVEKVQPLPQIVFITVDPERDTLEALKQYIDSFNPAFIAARPDEATLTKISQEIGISYMKVAPAPHENPQNYTMAHSGAVLLFNPKGQLLGFFSYPQQAASLVHDYQAILMKQGT